MKVSQIHIVLNAADRPSRIIRMHDALVRRGLVSSGVVFGVSKIRSEDNELSFRLRRKLVFLVSERLKFAPIRKLLKYLEFLVRACVYLEQQKPEIVNLHHVATLPVLPFVKMLSPESKIIYDAHELEHARQGADFFSNSVFYLLEKIFLKHVDASIFVSPGIKDLYDNKFKLKRSICILNVEQTKGKVPKTDVKKILGIPIESHLFVYQGVLSEVRNIPFLLHYFAQLSEEKMHCLFLGYGPLENTVQQHAEEFENIHFLGAVDPQSLVSYTLGCDFGIHIPLNTSLSYDMSLPNKFFQYLQAGKPILVSDCTTMAELVEKLDVGETHCSASYADFHEAVSRIVERGYTLSTNNNLQQFLVDNSWDGQEVKLESLMRQI